MHIEVNSDHIAVTTQPHLKDLCKSIPEGKWMPARRQWIYPRSPITAHYLIETFKGMLYTEKGLFALSGRLNGHDYDYADLMLNTESWLHQAKMIEMALARDGSMAHFEMSCGKSMTSIGIMNMMLAERVLIACPLKVMGVWPKQFRIHSKRKYHILKLDKGSALKKAKELRKYRDKTPLVVIVNYDSMWREGLADEILALYWDLFIMDECHRVKAYTGKAARSKFCAKVALQSKKRLGLTGTPMPHSPLDLWAQMRALDRTVFGTSFYKFKNKYAVMGGYQGKQILSFQNQDDLTKRFDLVSIYATKKNSLDLPDEIDIDVEVDLSQKMRILYNALEKDFIAWVDDIGEEITAKNALVKLLKLQELTSGFVRNEDGKDIQIDHAKADWLKEMLEDAGQKVVVFCRFKQDLKTIRGIANELKLNYGEVSGAHNDLTEDSTIKDETEVLGVQIQAGGLGVDFSKACIAVDYSVGFSLGDWLQARSRLHRQGQVNHVTFYHLKANRTVDEKLFKAFDNKMDAVKVIIDGLKTQEVPA